MDGSESISPSDFSASKQFAQRVLESSEAEEYCVISFSHTARLEVPLSSRARSIQVISNLSRKSGLTDLASPLNVARTVLARSALESKYLLLITDGSTTFWGKSSVTAAASALRGSDIQVFAVSVGDKKNETSLAQIAFSPSSGYQFSAKNLNRIPQLNGAWLDGVCDSTIRACNSGLNCGSGFALCDTCVCPSGDLSPDCSPSAGLSAGAIAGIALAVIAAVAIAALLSWRLYARQAAINAVPPAGDMINNVQDNPLYQGGGDNYNPLYQPM
jgi:hypothetical protein